MSRKRGGQKGRDGRRARAAAAEIGPVGIRMTVTELEGEGALPETYTNPGMLPLHGLPAGAELVAIHQVPGGALLAFEVLELGPGEPPGTDQNDAPRYVALPNETRRHMALEISFAGYERVLAGMGISVTELPADRTPAAEPAPG